MSTFSAPSAARVRQEFPARAAAYRANVKTTGAAVHPFDALRPTYTMNSRACPSTVNVSGGCPGGPRCGGADVVSAGVVGGAVVDSPPNDRRRHARRQHQDDGSGNGHRTGLRSMRRVELQFTNGRDNSSEVLKYALAHPLGRVLVLFPVGICPRPRPLSPARRVAHLYDDLRTLARARLRRAPTGHTLDTTSLVNEAWGLAQQHSLGAMDRPAFFNAAAATMRRVLVDSARARLREKRGAGPKTGSLDDVAEFLSVPEADELLLIDEALERLRVVHPRGADVVGMLGSLPASPSTTPPRPSALSTKTV